MKNHISLFLAAAVLLTFLSACGASAPATQPTAVQTQPTAATTVPETEAPTEMPTQTTAPVQTREAPETPVPVTAIQQKVYVTTADEFIAAIASNTAIILNAPSIDFSTATDYGTGNGEHYYWEDNFDGPSLVLTGLTNFTVTAEDEDHTTHQLEAVPRYAHVLTFENSSGILVKGITAGHVKEQGSCIGGVLYFRNCEDVLVENCGLFGCGVIGIYADYSKNIQVYNNDIYECSNGGIYMTGCETVTFMNNTFRDLGGPNFHIFICKDIVVDGQLLHLTEQLTGGGDYYGD